jgi:transposase
MVRRLKRTYPETGRDVVEWEEEEQEFNQKRSKKRALSRTRPWEVSDAVWERVRPLIPARPPHPKGGRPAEDDRQMFAAIVYVLRTGIQWNALPRELGASSTVYDRFRLWEKQEETQTTPAWIHAEALYNFGQILLSLGKLERAEVLAQEALQLAERCHDHGEMSSAYGMLGLVAQARGKLKQAATYLTESDAHAKLTGVAMIQATASLNLGELVRQQGDFARATTLFGEVLTMARTLGVVWVRASITTLLGHLASQQGKYTLAKANYREALTLYRKFDNATYTAWCLEGFAAALCAERHHAQVTRLCAAAATLRKRIHTPLPPAEREAFEQTIATTKAALDEQAFAREWAVGAALLQDEAIDYALSDACV